MSLMRRIYFFANFGDWNKLPFGGGEVGNRRTLDLFKKGGFEVVPIPKYLRVENHSFINLLKLIIRVVSNILSYTIILAFGRRKDSIVHIAGFYGPMIYFEYIIISIAKLFRYKVVYEMRGGGAEYYFNQGSKSYRRVFALALCKSDAIFSQGRENIPLIHMINKDIKIIYYPNYVTKDFYPQSYPDKPKNKIGLIYFGRISQSKHTDFVIDTFVQLHAQFNNTYLEIVGDCEDIGFMDKLKVKIKNCGYADFVSMYPACDHIKMKNHLRDKMFYLFPTTETREGHSNALTEAMSWGLIPIATQQGFNRSVIGDDKLIVQSLDVDSFVSCIASAIKSGAADSLSQEMYNRVLNNYTEDIVYKRIIGEYNNLFRMFFPKSP